MTQSLIDARVFVSVQYRTTSGQQQQDLRLAFHDSSVELICIRLRLFDCQNVGMKKYSISRALINVAANFSLQTSGYFT
jgi:hypothetical protein